jgi:hypothetical protein
VVGTEGLTASIAVELIAAGTEHLAASWIGTGVHFEECIAAVIVVFDRKALKQGVAGGAGGGVELLSHIEMMTYLRRHVERK